MLGERERERESAVEHLDRPVCDIAYPSGRSGAAWHSANKVIGACERTHRNR